jgi:hypothetical protein
MVMDYGNDVRTIPASRLGDKGADKQGMINRLRERWTDMDAEQKRENIRGLFGARVKLATIAKLIGRTEEEVRAASKGGK